MSMLRNRKQGSKATSGTDASGATTSTSTGATAGAGATTDAATPASIANQKQKQQQQQAEVLYWIAFSVLALRILFDLYVCPHSKVEESFQLQATHDLFYHGVGPAISRLLGSNGDVSDAVYDHWQFPGVVPRTFAGPSILALCCTMLRWVLLPIYGDIALDPMLVQFLARLSLACFALHGWYHLSTALNASTGVTIAAPTSSSSSASTQPPPSRSYAGHFLLLITACQFHLCFYASRMLPNTFALVVVLHAVAFWIQKHAYSSSTTSPTSSSSSAATTAAARVVPKAAAAIVFGTAVFRCDMLLLLFAMGISWLLCRDLGILQALRIGVVTGILSLALTCPLDSILWQRPLWPEGQVFYYNTILGKSSNWGTSPWHWYVTSAIPKAMLCTIFLIPFAFINVSKLFVSRAHTNMHAQASATYLDLAWLEYLLPVMGFIFLYSFLGHKELRFLFPAFPIFNMIAAVGLSKLRPTMLHAVDARRRKLWWILYLGVILFCLGTTLLGSLLFVAVSQQNYPGGEALMRLSTHLQHQRQRQQQQQTIKVYIDVASAMSGVSLFGQRSVQYVASVSAVQFDKGGYEAENQLPFLDDVTHILTETSQLDGFTIIDTIPGNPRLNPRQLRIDTAPAIYVMERE